MTAIVCFNWAMGAVLLGDSRISYPGPDGNIITVRDVCQKIWVPNGWSALGFAGDVCLGNSLVGAFFLAIRDKHWTRNHLLTDDQAMRELVSATVDAHTHELGGGHSACTTARAALLFAYVALVPVNNADGSLDHYELGVSTVDVSSDGLIHRSGLGAAVIGDGGEMIQPALTLERIASVANAGSPDLQTLHALLTTAHYIDKYSARSVGLPYQSVHIGPKGVTVVPYFYWADVTRRFGTYVAMRIENGDWVQHHRPTKTIVRIRRPFEILNQELDEGPWPLNKAEMFNPRRELTNQSPGVVRKPNPCLVYAPYDPLQVPSAILTSWGGEPLPALTWATRRSESDAAAEPGA